MEPKHTLLLVDDEENILHALRRVFRRMDCRILTAPSGPVGLELVRANAVSLVISDQRMPEMIGAEFLGHVREISPRTIRIMLTGYSDIEAATQAINEGYGFATDLNRDCYVNLQDVARFVADWLRCVAPNDQNCEHLWLQ